MHVTLERQLRRIYGDISHLPPGISEILPLIEQTYVGFDEDRRLLERSLDISSRELSDINTKLRAEKGAIEEVVIERTHSLEQARDIAQAAQIQLESKHKELEDQHAKTVRALAETERERSRNAELSQRLKMATTAAQIGIWDWDVDQNILHWDDTMYTLYSVRRQVSPLTYHQWTDLMSPTDRPRVMEEIRQAIEGVHDLNTIFQIVLDDKTLRDIRISAVTICDPNYKTTRMIGVTWDITKEKSLDRIKDEFLSVASHELRTPFTALRGLVEMILSGEFGPVNDKLQQPLTDIHTSCITLTRLVNDLLDISRIQAHRVHYRLTEFDVTTSIHSALELLSGLIQQKNISVDLTKVTPCIVYSDADRVTGILTNLIGNALKYMDAGTITLTTVLEGDYAKITIEDTGMGITESDRVKLFQKFQRLDTRQEGSGLGLYIVREMSRSLAGDVTLVRSAPGIGSLFAFTLPRAGSPTAHKLQRDTH